MLGDYNLPHLIWSYDDEINAYLPTNASSESEITLTESVLSVGLFQVLNVLNQNGRLLDLAFVNDAHSVEVLEPPTPLLKVDQHHKPILLNFHLPLKNDDTDYYDIRLDFRHYDVSAVCRSITAINWNVTLNENCGPRSHRVLQSNPRHHP